MVWSGGVIFFGALGIRTRGKPLTFTVPGPAQEESERRETTCIAVGRFAIVSSALCDRNSTRPERVFDRSGHRCVFFFTLRFFERLSLAGLGVFLPLPIRFAP